MRSVPLLFLDLDNTLVDRAAAFRLWAEDFVSAMGLPDDEVEWLITSDRDGYEPRDSLASTIRDRFCLRGSSAERLADDLRHGMIDWIVLSPEVPRAVSRSTEAGWVPFVITNGTVEQQEQKLRHTGLDHLVAGWVVSEAAGRAKPDRRIFDIAARSAGHALDGAWMIGDSAHHDIGGAHAAGIQSAWLHRGRTWETGSFAPSVIVESCPAAVDHIIGHYDGG